MAFPNPYKEFVERFLLDPEKSRKIDSLQGRVDSLKNYLRSADSLRDAKAEEWRIMNSTDLDLKDRYIQKQLKKYPQPTPKIKPYNTETVFPVI